MKKEAPNTSATPKPVTKTLDLDADADFQAMSAAGKTGFLSKITDRFNDALQNSRGSGVHTSSAPALAQRSVDDVALLRARNTKSQKMYIPEGVIIEGSLSGGSETEIHGRVEGNVTVDGALFLGKSALVTGNIRAGACQLDGMVEGKVECSEDLILTATGRLNADAVAGRQIRVAGAIQGNATTPGALRIDAGGVVNGDVKARVFSMSEGAQLNGRCMMRSPAQQGSDNSSNKTAS